MDKYYKNKIELIKKILNWIEVNNKYIRSFKLFHNDSGSLGLYLEDGYQVDIQELQEKIKNNNEYTISIRDLNDSLKIVLVPDADNTLEELQEIFKIINSGDLIICKSSPVKLRQV